MLGSGSSGNSTCIQSGSTKLLIDAGFSARELRIRLMRCGIDPSSLTAVIITHEHSDHIRGLSHFARRYPVNLFSTERALECSRISRKDLASFHRIDPDVAFSVGDLEIRPFSLPHDAEDTFGFLIRCNGIKVAYATDLGYPSKRVADEMKDANCIIVEANHDVETLMKGPYPWFLKERLLGRRGHLSNRSMGELVEQIIHDETRALVLAHLSEVNNTEAMALEEAQRAVRQTRVKKMRIIVSSQDEPSELVKL